MKLMRYGLPGQERPGLLDQDGILRDLSAHCEDIHGQTLSPTALAALREIPPATLPVVAGRPRIGACVGQVGKLVCVGLNYADHAAEAGLPLPEEPLLFMKATTAICGAYDDIQMPVGGTKLDWEVELAIVIGMRARRIDQADAMAHVAGFCVINDVTERTFQFDRGGSWDKGKSHDSFAPLGPWLVTTDELRVPGELDLWLDVDDVRRQAGNTRTMVFKVPEIVAYVSQFMTLEPGDVIATGTPPGVGMGIKPDPVFLRVGQSVRAGISGLGEQCQRVVSIDVASDLVERGRDACPSVTAVRSGTGSDAGWPVR